MSSKSILWIAIAVIVLGGVWYYFGRSSSPAATYTPSVQQTGAEATAQQPGVSANSGVQASASLDQDLQAIDTQAKAAGDASATANSTTDTPVVQTE